MAISDILPILAISISIIGLGISLYTHKRNEDLPLIKDHFQDLKTSVIEPLLNIVIESQIFYDLKELTGSISIGVEYTVDSDDPHKDSPFSYKTFRIDRMLLQDLVHNHYPIVKKLWGKNFELYSEKISFHQKLRNKFIDVFEKEFKNKQLDISEFRIWRIIEYFLIEKCFKSNNLTIKKVHSTKYYLYLGEWRHKEIYDGENEHIITSIKQILDQIFQNVLQSEEIKHQLEIYKLKCNNYETNFDELESLLTRLKYKKKLYFEKDDVNNNLCKIIDSRI